MWTHQNKVKKKNQTITRSAITAGFLGSSSGIPCSTFPTRSAPTSAAFVYIPPPNWANSATKEAPNPYPTRRRGTEGKQECSKIDHQFERENR